jgi:serine/alanine adding enzyme
VVYGGMLCAPGSDGQEALQMLLVAYQRELKSKILFTECRNMSDLSDVQPVMQACNFPFERHLNYLIDLQQSEDTLWQNISKSGRQSIRSSINKGTVVEEITDSQQLTIAYKLLQKVYDRVHVPLADIDLFKMVFDRLSPFGMARVFMARVGDRYIGTCFTLLYKDRIIDWYAASDRDFSSYCSGELLIWRILQWGKEHGFKVFDFGGAGKPDQYYGPRDFKSKFGGDLVDFGRNVCVHAPWTLGVSKTAYIWYQKFMSTKLFRNK